MECIVSRNSELTHRCNLPRRFLDHVLSEGHQFDKDQLLVVCISDTANNQNLFVAMKEFLESSELTAVELPLEYLPFAESVIVTYIRQPTTAKRLVFQPYNSGFYKLPAPDKSLENFIKKECPCLNHNIDYVVEGCKLNLYQVLDEAESPVDYTVAYNHNIEVELLEPLVTTPPPKKPSSPVFVPKEVVSELVESKHGTGLKLGGKTLTPEEIRAQRVRRYS